MKLHQHGYSPVALDQIVTLNGQVKSGSVAIKVLKKLTSISICESHLMELTETIGAELAKARDQQAAEYLAGTLQPQFEQTPQVVAVATDGGRIFTRAQDAGRGVYESAWKETKIACLITLHSEVSEGDPHPELPTCFTDQASVDKLVREIKSIRNATQVSSADDIHDDGKRLSEADKNLAESLVIPPEPTIDSQCEQGRGYGGIARLSQPETSDWGPQRLVRTCVSSLCSSDEFGPMVAAEAQRRNFFAAPRRAFLGDGLPWNWTLQRQYFPDFEPIVDFIHPMTYIYEAARAVASEGHEWPLCLRWLTACWQGHVSLVLDELRHWQVSHPSPPDEKLAASDGRAIVSKSIQYLTNNVSRMNYPKYRKAGLPITSSMVESLIKEFNYRVKGTEKSWNRPTGGESILQVRGAVLCDDKDRLSDYILARPGCAFYRPSTARNTTEQNHIAA